MSSTAHSVAVLPDGKYLIGGSFVFTDEGPSGVTHQVARLGVTVAGPLVFAPDPVSFGEVTVATSRVRSVTVTDTGAAAVVPSAIRPAGSGVAVSGGTCAVGRAVPAGGSCTVALSWTPAAASTLAGGSVTLAYPYGTTAGDTVALTGTGLAAPVTRPKAPSSATYTVTKSRRTVVRWAGSVTAARAASAVSGYRVRVNGARKCTTGAAASQCRLRKSYGKKARVEVVAFNDAGTSPPRRAKYRTSRTPVLFGTIRFAANSAHLSRPSRNTVRRYTAVLVSQGFTRVTLNGYTARNPDGGHKAFRNQLSKDRAKAVKRVMRKKLRNLDASLSITIRARGGADPIGDNTTDKGRAKNRRATINIR